MTDEIQSCAVDIRRGTRSQSAAVRGVKDKKISYVKWIWSGWIKCLKNFI